MFFNQSAADSIAYNMIREADRRVSDHFLVREFASRDGSAALLIHPRLVTLLEAVRTHFGRPVVIHSGYRSGAHNAAVGGSPRSKHLLGLAADIVVRGVDAAVVARFCDGLDVGGLGRYPTFTHVDVAGEGRRWSK